MDESAILSALQKGVTAAVAASTMPALAIAYVIPKNFTKPTNRKYLEIVWIPNNRSDFWGEERNYQGMMRLVLHWPNDGSDPYQVLAVLQSVCGYFTKSRVLSGVQVYDTPSLTGSPIGAGDEVLFAASMRYQSYRSS